MRVYFEQFWRRLDPLWIRLDALRDQWDALPPERQQQGRLAAVVVAVALPIFTIFVPLIGGRIGAIVDRSDAYERLHEMQELEREGLERGMGRADTQAPVQRSDESLLGVVDAVARKVEVSPRVQAMRPIGNGRSGSDEAVEVQMQGLVLEELVRFMYQLEMEKPRLTIRRLETQKDLKTPNVLRVSLEVAR